MSKQPAQDSLLTEYRDQILAAGERIDAIERRYRQEKIYEIVTQGLFLMKAQALFADGVRGPGKAIVQDVHNGSTPRREGGQFLSLPGFDAWLDEHFIQGCALGRRTAYNYIAYAKGAGLKVTDTLAAIDELRQGNALHGKTLSQLLDGDALEPNTKPPVLVRHMAHVQKNLDRFRDDLSHWQDSDLAAFVETYESLVETARRLLSPRL